MIIFLYYILNVQAIGESCDDRTPYFEETSGINTNNSYFNPRTLSKETYLVNSREQLINELLQRGITCVGKWCNEDWGCYNGINNCYHREHIIPTNNNLITLINCPDKSAYDVRANQVMSYGKWNIQLSNKYLGEKTKVYGKDAVKIAYNAVYQKCFGNLPIQYPEDLCMNSINYNWIFTILFLPVILFVLIAGLIYYIEYVSNTQITQPINLTNENELIKNILNNSDSDPEVELFDVK